jgi:hypothetical protein
MVTQARVARGSPRSPERGDERNRLIERNRRPGQFAEHHMPFLVIAGISWPPLFAIAADGRGRSAPSRSRCVEQLWIDRAIAAGAAILLGCASSA